jgi:long-chain acyl-CoA synthetase
VLKRKEHAHFSEDGLHIAFCRWSAPAAAAADLPAVTPQDLAVLQYTGGTTGTAQGRDAHPRQPAANSAQMLRHLGHDMKSRSACWASCRCSMSLR